MGFLRGSCGQQDYDRRSPIGVPLSAPTFGFSNAFCVPEGYPTPSYPGFCSDPSSLEHYPEGLPGRTSVLFETFCRPEERWPKPSYYRPLHSEHLFDHPQVQDGTDINHCSLYSYTNVGDHFGPYKRLLSCANPLASPSLPGFCGRRDSLCLSVSPVRALHRPLGFQPNNEADKIPPSSSFIPVSHISGRLFSPGLEQRRSSPETGLCAPVSGEFRYPGESEEVEPGSLSDGRIPWGGLPSGHTTVVSSPRQGSEDSVTLPGNISLSPQVSTSARVPGRRAELCQCISSPWSPSSKANYHMDESQHQCSFKGSSSSCGRISQEMSRGVDAASVPKCGCPYGSSSAVSDSNDRCLPVRVGWGLDTPFSFRNLASFFPRLLHQLPGTSGDLPVSPTFLPSHPWSVCAAFIRQFVSHCMHLQSGFPPFSSSHESVIRSSGVLLQPLHHTRVEAPQWSFECSCRPGVSLGTCFHRVESGSQILPLDLLSGRRVTSGLVRHEGESPPSCLCVAMSRPGGCGHQCPLHPVGQVDLNLPFSTSSSSSQSFGQTTSISRKGGPSGPLLCSIKLAPQPSSKVSRPRSTSRQSLIVSSHQGRASFPSKSVHFSSSRLETIRSGLLASGFDKDSADIYLLSHRDSTSKQYQSVWSKFLSFLDLRGIMPVDTSISAVCNFLAFQAKHENRKYRTVSGYRCALRLPILWACDLDINCLTSDQFLRGLFNFSPPVKARPMPMWNINVLLDYLQSSRFEPLDEAPFPLLSQKVLCLLLLASGRRISEISNLSRSFSVSQSGLSISLDWVPDFRPKHFVAGFQPDCPSISFLAIDGSTDLSLCPVRAYKIFLSRSPSSHGDLISQPFWSHPTKSAPVSTSQLTGLFIGVVKDCLLASGLPASVPIGPHQMRKLAASLSNLVGHNEEIVRKRMGFSSVKILRKNYIAKVPHLRIACVLPGGPYFPVVYNQLSDSD